MWPRFLFRLQGIQDFHVFSFTIFLNSSDTFLSSYWEERIKWKFWILDLFETWKLFRARSGFRSGNEYQWTTYIAFFFWYMMFCLKLFRSKRINVWKWYNFYWMQYNYHIKVVLKWKSMSLKKSNAHRLTSMSSFWHLCQVSELIYM